MKKLLKTLMMLVAVILCSITATAQDAVTIRDSVAVKASGNSNASTVIVLNKGHLLTSQGTTINGFTHFQIGWINEDDIVFFNSDLNTVQDGNNRIVTGYAAELLNKNSSELTEREILYLMLHERRKDEALRADIKTLKNAQVLIASAVTVSFIGSIIFALSQ